MASGWSRGATIGRGSTATVSLAISRDSGALFAVKSAQLPTAAQLYHEHSILSSLSSPYIVRCLGNDITHECGSELYNLFMEYFPQGTLCDEIKRQGGRLPEQEIKRHLRSVLLGLRYLHGMGIVHRDIKGSNLLLSRGGNVRIGDLGSSSRTGGAAEAGGLAGTPLFMAPEVARGQSQGTPADVWALGCTVVEMATGRPPWTGDVTDPVSVLYRIGCTDAVPELPVNLSEEGQDFLRRCFCRNPWERWTAEQLLQHSFVNKSMSVVVAGKPFSDTPKGILDRDFWDSVPESSAQTGGEEGCGSSPVLASVPSASNRITALFCPAVRKPDWSWGENWVPVRANAPEDPPSQTISDEQHQSEPAILSSTSELVDDDQIKVENSATLSAGIIEEEICGQSVINRVSSPINFIDSVINQIVDKCLTKMKLMQILLSLSLPFSFSLSRVKCPFQ